MTVGRAARWRRRLLIVGTPLLAVLAAKQFAFDFYRVRENSMWPSLKGGEDRVWVDKTAVARRSIGRGDVVVFRRDGVGYVKRVLSTGGESVTFRGGDLFVRDDDGEFVRPSRDPEAAKAVRVPIYPGAAGFAVLPETATSDDGTGYGFASIAGSGSPGRVALKGANDGGDGVLRDDHPGADGRLVRGRHAVADLAVEIGALKLSAGASFAIVHRLRDETRKVSVGPEGPVVEVEEKGLPIRITPFPGAPVPAGLRVETLDGMFTVSVRREGAWVELWREPRATDRFGGWSTLSFEVRDGRATLGELAVTRDAHYVDADGRDDCPVWAVPPGEFFLVGDNVPVSTDSRIFGTVKAAELVGRVASVWRR